MENLLYGIILNVKLKSYESAQIHAGVPVTLKKDENPGKILKKEFFLV